MTFVINLRNNILKDQNVTGHKFDVSNFVFYKNKNFLISESIMYGWVYRECSHIFLDYFHGTYRTVLCKIFVF